MKEAIHQKVVFVDGEEFKIHIFAPSRALKVLARLTKLIGVPMMAMAGKDRDSALDAAPAAMKALVDRLDEDNVVSLVAELLTSVSHQNKQVNMDLDFAGRLGTMTKLIKEVIEAQYTDFFEAVSGLMGEEESPNTQKTA
jgi:hypothetical protein